MIIHGGITIMKKTAAALTLAAATVFNAANANAGAGGFLNGPDWQKLTTVLDANNYDFDALRKRFIDNQAMMKAGKEEQFVFDRVGQDTAVYYLPQKQGASTEYCARNYFVVATLARGGVTSMAFSVYNGSGFVAGSSVSDRELITCTGYTTSERSDWPHYTNARNRNNVRSFVPVAGGPSS